MKKRLYWILCYVLKYSANIYIWKHRPYIIGITGSVGKTSCRMIIHQVLQELSKEQVCYSSPKNFNSELGLIFSIFQIESYSPSIKSILYTAAHILHKTLFGKKEYDIFIAEYGIDSPGDMDFLLSIMRPHIGILTKLDSVHSINFPGGIDEYWQDKLKLLISSSKHVFYNASDEYISHNINLVSQRKVAYVPNTIKGNYTIKKETVIQSFSYKGGDISINLVGDDNKDYTILALEIAQTLGIPLTEKTYHFDYILQKGRFSIFKKNNNIFIDSSYNATPESMKKVIQNIKTLQQEVYPYHRIGYVLGDMRELGYHSSAAHTMLVDAIFNSAFVYTIGPEMYTYLRPLLLSRKYTGIIYNSLCAKEVGKTLKKYLRDTSDIPHIILFKGSQNTIFTEEALAPQLHPSQRKNLPRQSEDWQEKKQEFFQSL